METKKFSKIPTAPSATAPRLAQSNTPAPNPTPFIVVAPSNHLPAP